MKNKIVSNFLIWVGQGSARWVNNEKFSRKSGPIKDGTKGEKIG